MAGSVQTRAYRSRGTGWLAPCSLQSYWPHRRQKKLRKLVATSLNLGMCRTRGGGRATGRAAAAAGEGPSVGGSASLRDASAAGVADTPTHESSGALGMPPLRSPYSHLLVHGRYVGDQRACRARGGQTGRAATAQAAHPGAAAYRAHGAGDLDAAVRFVEESVHGCVLPVCVCVPRATVWVREEPRTGALLGQH